MNDSKDTVYYDGDCPMCSAVAENIKTSSKGDNFFLKDIKKETLPPHISMEAANKEIHVVSGEGKVYKNANGILRILERYPAWSFWVRVGRLPLLRNILPLGYKLISANRHLFSRYIWPRKKRSTF